MADALRHAFQEAQVVASVHIHHRRSYRLQRFVQQMALVEVEPAVGRWRRIGRRVESGRQPAIVASLPRRDIPNRRARSLSEEHREPLALRSRQ